MCGNGTRVFAAYLRREGLETADEFEIATRAGLKLVRFEDDLIAVNLGDWRIGDPDGAPRQAATTPWSRSPATTPCPALSLDLGNPHTVVALPDSADLAGLDLTRAPEINPQPPHGTNVEFVRPLGAGHLSDAGARARRGGDPLLRHGRRGRRARHPLAGPGEAPTPTYGASTSPAAPCASGRCPASRSSCRPGRPGRRRDHRPHLSAAPVSRGGVTEPGVRVPVHGPTTVAYSAGPSSRALAVSGLAVPLAAAGHGVGVRRRGRPLATTSGRQAPASALPKVPVMTGSGGAVASVDRDASQVGIDVLRPGRQRRRRGRGHGGRPRRDRALQRPASAAAASSSTTTPSTHRVRTVDGRETAPRTFTPTTFTKPDGTAMDFNTVVSSGLSVGRPGHAGPLGRRRPHASAPGAGRPAGAGRAARPQRASRSTRPTTTRPRRTPTRFAKFPATAKVFLPGGKPPGRRARCFRNPDMAKAYAELRRKGVNAALPRRARHRTSSRRPRTRTPPPASASWAGSSPARTSRPTERAAEGAGPLDLPRAWTSTACPCRARAASPWPRSSTSCGTTSGSTGAATSEVEQRRLPAPVQRGLGDRVRRPQPLRRRRARRARPRS